MPPTTLHVDREGASIYVFAKRDALTGAEVARVTAQLKLALNDFVEFRFAPAHDSDVFAWTVEFEHTEAAAEYVCALLDQGPRC